MKPFSPTYYSPRVKRDIFIWAAESRVGAIVLIGFIIVAHLFAILSCIHLSSPSFAATIFPLFDWVDYAGIFASITAIDTIILLHIYSTLGRHRPNKSPEPTTTSVMPAAKQPPRRP